MVLPVEHQPASGRAPGAGGAISFLSACARDLCCNARAGYWPVLLGAGAAAGVLVMQEVALAHLPLLMIGGVLTLPPVALTSLPPSARLAHVIASGRGPHRRGAIAIPAPAGAGEAAWNALPLTTGMV